MRKAIQLKATVVVTGDAEPATDFARLAISALRKVVRAGGDAEPDLEFTVKRVIESRGDDEETDESGGADEG
jgi:hypothetical protein